MFELCFAVQFHFQVPHGHW